MNVWGGGGGERGDGIEWIERTLMFKASKRTRSLIIDNEQKKKKKQTSGGSVTMMMMMMMAEQMFVNELLFLFIQKKPFFQ